MAHPHFAPSYSALSLIDNVPVLSVGRIFTTGSLACSEHRCTCCTQTPQIKLSTGSCVQYMHNSPALQLLEKNKGRYDWIFGVNSQTVRLLTPPPPPFLKILCQCSSKRPWGGGTAPVEKQWSRPTWMYS